MLKMFSFPSSCLLKVNPKYSATLFLEYLCCLLDPTLRWLGHLRVCCWIEVTWRKFKQLETSSTTMTVRNGSPSKAKNSRFQGLKIKFVNLCILLTEPYTPSMTAKGRFQSIFPNGMKIKRKTEFSSQMFMNLSKTTELWYPLKQCNFPLTLLWL